MRLIPAIDLLDGEVVRLWRGEFGKRTRYALEPAALAVSFRDAGATALHVVDLNAARGDADDNREIVRELAAIDGLSVQCGGGVRGESDVEALLEAGAARAVVGSMAADRPACALEWFGCFGAERLVIALDVRIAAHGRPVLRTHGWRETSGNRFETLLARYADAGLKHLLCTDIGRDGSLSGPNRELYRGIRRCYPDILLQASGGVADIEDVRALREDALPAAILGRALLDGCIALDEALRAAA